MNIKNISAIWVLDSRGMPTVQARVEGERGTGVASVPSGASTGKFEAVEKRDGDPKKFFGKGVQSAVDAVNHTVNGALAGKSFDNLKELDEALLALDGTQNKENLGANALLAVSMAGAKAFAEEAGVPLYQFLGGDDAEFVMPTPMMNILNGGAHASNNVEIQEFMVMPTGARDFSEAMQMGAEVYAALKSELNGKGLSTAVGDEGGFAPDLKSDEEAIIYILQAAARAGVEGQVAIALDAAASEWVTETGEYVFPKSNRAISGEELIEYYMRLVSAYPIVSIEDPMGEEDYSGFAALSKALSIQVVGDDLYVTNTERIQMGIDLSLSNAVLIKPNQIGTVSETIAAVDMAKQANYAAVISHRSGETEDTFIADLAVGLGTGQIKTGAPARGERTVKYNRLLTIANELGQVPYGGSRYLTKK